MITLLKLLFGEFKSEPLERFFDLLSKTFIVEFFAQINTFIGLTVTLLLFVIFAVFAMIFFGSLWTYAVAFVITIYFVNQHLKNRV